MSVQTQGTAHLFGIQAGVSAITNATVVSFTEQTVHANSTETVDEIGNLIEDRMDDQHATATLVLRPRSGFIQLTLGGLYTFNSVDYTVKSITKNESSSDFVTYSYELRSCEYITEA